MIHGFETKDLDNLKVQLVTCELYRCGYCEKKCTMLSDIKQYVKTEHIQYIKRIEVIQSRMDFPELLKKSKIRTGPTDSGEERQKCPSLSLA